MLGRSAGDRRGDDGSRLWGPNDPDRRVTAWIGTSVVVRGHVTSSEDTTIAGRVEGDIEVRDNVLVSAPGAHVEGNSVALTVVVNGRITGDIEAMGNIEIGATGAVYGDIVTPRMAVAEGATLEGRLSIVPAKKVQAA